MELTGFKIKSKKTQNKGVLAQMDENAIKVEEEKKQRFRILGMKIEFWLIAFIVAGSIPLVNFISLPIVFIIFGFGLLLYILGRALQIPT